MAKHYITGPAAVALVGNPAAVTAYETNLQSDRVFSGRPYSRVACIAVNAGGENVTIDIPGSISGLTPELVAQKVSRLEFPRISFGGLTIEVKGAEFNRINYTGVAAKAEIFNPTPPTTTTK